MRQVHRDLGNLGISTTDFDLRDTKGVCQVKESLRDFDMAFVTGGNSFVLRKRMQESGFDKAILEIMEKGLAYCGESAGSVVAGKLIASAEVEDIMSVESPVQEGLGLIDRIVIPHANWKRRQEYIDQSLATYGSDILLLRDYDTHIVTQ